MSTNDYGFHLIDAEELDGEEEVIAGVAKEGEETEEEKEEEVTL